MKEVIGNGENKLISVLIPIYNTEKFLAECLESIINQTYKNIEILCADDGSTDASAEIIREYARKDSRIIPIFEGRNGVSKTRNILLEAAKGEIIYFIDSDDFLDNDALELLYHRFEKDRLDLLFFDLEAFYEDNCSEFSEDRVEYYKMHSDYSHIYSGIDLLDHMEKNNDFLPCPVKYIASRELIGEQRFINGIIYEDEPYTYELLLKSKKASYYHKAFYHRRFRTDSIITSGISFDHVYGSFIGFHYMVNKTIEYMGGYNNINEAERRRLRKSADKTRRFYMELSEEEKNRLEELSDEEKALFYISIEQNKLFFEEKKELNNKLHKTYEEKAERGVRLRELERKYSSKDYKIGYMVLWIPRKIRSILKNKGK